MRSNYAEFKQGTRVRVIGDPISMHLRSYTGHIVGPAPEWDGYLIVHLDLPGVYFHANGEHEDLYEIREYYDNLEITN